MKDDPSRVNAINVLERFRVLFRANGKREMQVGNFSNLKWAEKKLSKIALRTDDVTKTSLPPRLRQTLAISARGHKNAGWKRTVYDQFYS